jgi:hypothetical protein
MDLELFAVAGCLVALAAFIAWEAWRRRVWAKQVDRALLGKGFVPGATQREVVLFVLAGAVGIVGLYLVGRPPVPPFSGRRAWLASLLYEHIGLHGLPVVVLFASLVMLLLGLSARRRRLRAEP